MTRYPSPLRYPGGKAKLAPALVDLFERVPIDMCEVWVEPFAGGAGAAISAVAEHDVPEAWLVEANPALRAFWQVLLSPAGEAFAARVEATKPTLELFYTSRDFVHRSYTCHTLDQFDLAYAAFIVNRCSFSGIVAGNAGPIGGANQRSKYTVESRFNAPTLARRLRAVTELSSRMRVIDTDDGIGYIESLPSSGVEWDVFVFCDPPYVDDAPRLYERHFDANEHRRLARALQALPSPWVATYDDHSLIRELYSDYIVEELPMRHTAGHAHSDTELLIHN